MSAKTEKTRRGGNILRGKGNRAMTVETRKELTRTVERAYYEAHGLCAHYSCTSKLAEARDIAARQEHIGAASVDVCAMFFAVRGFLASKRERRFTDRSDFVVAYGAIEEVERAIRFHESAEGAAKLRKFRREFGHLREADFMDLIDCPVGEKGITP